ncbi:MAG: hypothetical protein ACR2PW_07730 [Gammaproteobacteria bacterium]
MANGDPSSTLPEQQQSSAFQQQIEQARLQATITRQKVFNWAVQGGAAFVLLSAIYFVVSRIELDTAAADESAVAEQANAANDNVLLPLREVFIDQLEHYDREVDPLVAEWRVQELAADVYMQLTQTKAAALGYFANEQYQNALDSLQQSMVLVQDVVDDLDEQFRVASQNAQSALAAEHVESAQNWLQAALRIQPEDVQVQQLHQRIKVLPEILALLQQAEVLRHENRSDQEQAALQKVLALDRQRLVEVGPRLTQLKRRAFSQVWSSAYRSLEAGDLAAAGAYLQRAARLLPDNAQLKKLQYRLQQQQQGEHFANLMLTAWQAQQQDNWPKAQQQYAQAIVLAPRHDEARTHHQQAQQVNDAARTLSRLIARPDRLQDAGIEAKASDFLRGIAALRPLSPSLAQEYEKLERLIALYVAEGQVVVVSDNQTDIGVRGHGKIGRTLRRTVSLRPGDYVFEGVRKGYRSKLVKMRLEPGVSSAEITVVCDEKL